MKQQITASRIPPILLTLFLGLGAFLTLLGAVQQADARAGIASRSDGFIRQQQPGDSVTGSDAVDCSTLGATQADCEALVALYDNTGGTSWITQTNWLTGSPCDDWYGVTCDIADERVTALALSENNLSGGPLPAQIGGMSELTSLDLGGNLITGTIPTELSMLAQAINIRLDKNSFSGEIPSSLSDLAPSLLFLYLNGNMLGGTVPEALCDLKPIAELTGNIYLEYNKLNIHDSAACLGTSWHNTQTAPPEPTILNPGTVAGSGTLEVSWETIPFATLDGFYEVRMGTASGTYDEDLTRQTLDKMATSVNYTGLDTNETYYVVVRTQSPADPAHNPNVLFSEPSGEISTESVALSLTEISAAPGGAAGAILGAAFLLLAALSVAAAAYARRG